MFCTPYHMEVVWWWDSEVAHRIPAGKEGALEWPLLLSPASQPPQV